ncbi:YdhR family protein [uncultured Neptuniibacter sp.]|uniref:YdhR family protein n=1 Tax=uncultured Neptuniibacter sp. TaxID=502143 RepID=UPI00261FA601|nr:YdhR family protein [uncultured Neptuniibacter sp.]
MITTITKFKLSESITRNEARDIFLSTAPKYQDLPGLYRKSYFVSEDGNTVGGIYLWESRAHAEAIYTESWKSFVRDKYGSEPSVEYLDTPVIVDNVTHEIVTDD